MGLIMFYHWIISFSVRLLQRHWNWLVQCSFFLVCAWNCWLQLLLLLILLTQWLFNSRSAKRSKTSILSNWIKDKHTNKNRKIQSFIPCNWWSQRIRLLLLTSFFLPTDSNKTHKHKSNTKTQTWETERGFVLIYLDRFPLLLTTQG